MVAGLLLSLLLSAAPAGEASMARVGPGVYRPLYPATPEERELQLPAFRLDRRPVTNAEFLRFVEGHPRWRRDRVSRLFAGESYLSHWRGPTSLGPGQGEQPVTRVSWFAARAYCAARGARLPTEAQWELAAAATATSPDGRDDPEIQALLLAWYSRPTPKVLRPAGSGEPNHWGVRDLHGLVWEWVSDFGATALTGDSRESGDPDVQRFCGAGASSTGSNEEYASFMRFAFRGSLQASYAIGNLGFRCAQAPGVNR